MSLKKFIDFQNHKYQIFSNERVQKIYVSVFLLVTIIILIFFSIIIHEIHSLNLPRDDKDLIKNTKVSSNNTIGDGHLLGETYFGIYIGGGVGGLVGLIILLLILYCLCFRRGR